jgi:hypothetical protein
MRAKKTNQSAHNELLDKKRPSIAVTRQNTVAVTTILKIFSAMGAGFKGVSLPLVRFCIVFSACFACHPSNQTSMPVEILTRQDLYDFERRLLAEIRKLVDLIPPKPEEKTYIRTEEVMQLLKVSHRTLLRFRSEGTLKATRIGRILYYDYRYIRLLMMHKRLG